MLSHFILHIETIGPKHLSVCLCVALNHLYPDDNDLRSKMNRIKEVAYITEKRNEIAHGEWHIGPEYIIISDKPELPEKIGIKRKVSKDGKKIEELPTLVEFIDLIAINRKLADDIVAICLEVTKRETSKFMATRAQQRGSQG